MLWTGVAVDPAAGATTAELPLFTVAGAAVSPDVEEDAAGGAAVGSAEAGLAAGWGAESFAAAFGSICTGSAEPAAGRNVSRLISVAA